MLDEPLVTIVFAIGYPSVIIVPIEIVYRTSIRTTISFTYEAGKQKRMDFLKVSSKSSPSSVAGAIAGMIKDGVPVEIQSVGAGAVNQAIKAIAISRGFLSPVGIEVACVPSFADITINGESRTAIRLSVIPHRIDLTANTVELPSREESARDIMSDNLHF